eukprot:11170843-Lingulodinium_polyedra.AAC.1
MGAQGGGATRARAVLRARAGHREAGMNAGGLGPVEGPVMGCLVSSSDRRAGPAGLTCLIVRT